MNTSQLHLTGADVVSFLFKLPNIEALMKKENQTILTPLVSLDTPGKATVQVVILADPVSSIGNSNTINFSVPVICLTCC